MRGAPSPLLRRGRGRLSNHAAPLHFAIIVTTRQSSSKLDSALAAPIIDGASIQKKSCKPNAASLLIAEAQPIFMGEAHNVRATRRSGYIPSGGGAWGGEALLELFSREKW